MILVIQSQDSFPFSGEQECRDKLNIMCGYKSRESVMAEQGITRAVSQKY